MDDQNSPLPEYTTWFHERKSERSGDIVYDLYSSAQEKLKALIEKEELRK